MHFARDSVTMCPPAFDASADMVFNGTDGQAIMYLSRLRRNCPLPDHVIDLHPYQLFMPHNLPGQMWYLVCSTEKNRTEFGFWRQKGAACEIFTNSDISGWRTTLEFIEIKDARENLTDWVMQEYKITEKGPCPDKIEKESRAICNVFRSDRKNSDLEVHPDSREAVILDRNGIHSVASIVPRIETERSTSMFLVNNGVDSGLLVSEANRHLDSRIRDIVEHHSIADDHYLELDDLADPPSHSTSSDASSRSSFTLGDHEYFDYEALLRELESNNNQSLQTKSNSSFGATTSASHLGLDEYHHAAEDDYLELDDLADPLSRSTSSDISSRSSFTLGDREYFDSEALLGKLESDNNQSLQAKSSSSFSVTASAKPFEVLMQPATLGSLVCASERQPPVGRTLPSLNHKTKDTDERVPDHTVKPGEQEKKGDPSCPAGAASSSNSGTLVSTGKRKAAAVKKKGLKKYLCFMP